LGIVSTLCLARREAVHYAICVRCWYNAGANHPRSFHLPTTFGHGVNFLHGDTPEWGFELCVWLMHPGVTMEEIVRRCRSMILASGTLAPVEQTERELGDEFTRRMRPRKALQAR
jgi:hypothetical protein